MVDLSVSDRDIDWAQCNDTISVTPFRPSDVTFA